MHVSIQHNQSYMPWKITHMIKLCYASEVIVSESDGIFIKRSD